MTDRKIAIFHYHLRKGGVTTVIKDQVAALRDNKNLLVITGETPEDFVHDHVMIIPELGYTKTTEKNAAPEKIAARLLSAVEKHFGAQCDILHFHNPVLAKNRDLVKIINIILGRNVKVFLQVHDFAEDGRPMSYIKSEYPVNAHYGVINSRDYAFLLNCGIKEEGLHFIPNCVHPAPGIKAYNKHNNLILYPVRAIRRKNIGEILLLSLFIKKGDFIGITLPALNYQDIQSYEDWKFFAAASGLPVEFDLGLKYEFNALIEKSKYFITTSITEGFGFVYLQPWIYRRYLLGRIIPDICADFEKNGIVLSHLYDKLLVPSGLINRAHYLAQIKARLINAERIFGMAIDKDLFLSYFKKMTTGDFIDFGLLPEKIQTGVILEVIKKADTRKQILAINEKLTLFADNSFNTDINDQKETLIDHNAAIINRVYSEAEYKKRLNTIYSKIMNTPAAQKIDKNKLLSCFLQPHRFSLLKWGAYDK